VEIARGAHPRCERISRQAGIAGALASGWIRENNRWEMEVCMDRIDSYLGQDYRERLNNHDREMDDRIGVQLNSERDLPLLLAVRNSTFVSHDQLFQLMVATGIEHDRRCFNWRIRRLIRGAHVRKTPVVDPYKGVVYSITRFGLAVLESYGEGLISITSDSRNLPSLLQAPHFLELSEIHTAFKTTGRLKSWKSDRELISLNYVIGTPLAKDYDAIAEIEAAGDSLRIAIEYERTLKSADRYKEIQKAIQDEGQVDMVLYLTSTLDLVFTLSREFNHPALPMCFVSSRKLRANLLETVLLFAYGSMRETFSLRDAITTVLPIKG